MRFPCSVGEVAQVVARRALRQKASKADFEVVLRDLERGTDQKRFDPKPIALPLMPKTSHKMLCDFSAKPVILPLRSEKIAACLPTETQRSPPAPLRPEPNPRTSAPLRLSHADNGLMTQQSHRID